MTSSNVAPPAVRMASTFWSVRMVCAATSPRCTYSPLAGSTAPCPETCTNGPRRTPCEKVWAGAGASAVEMAVRSAMEFLSWGLLCGGQDERGAARVAELGRDLGGRFAKLRQQ